jgi:ABC-type nitrate/sulfonate/bicarbonate transport system substrate-binding protein
MVVPQNTRSNRPALDNSRAGHRGVFAVGAVAIALVVAACGSSNSGSGTNGKVVIGYETGGSSALASVIHNKYFQKEMGSTKVSEKVFSSGPAALSAIASGALNFMCVLGLPPVISAIAKGVPLKIISAQDRYTANAGLVARDATGITSVSGLKGKTVGIVVGSQSTFELAQYLKTAGMTLADVKQVNMAPPQIQSAWATGQIDAGIVWAPVYNYMAEHEGKVLMNDANLPTTSTSYNVCVTNGNYAAKHPAQVTAFLHALDRGSKFAAANATKAAGYNASINGISLAGAQTIDKGYFSPSLAEQLTPDVLGATQDEVAKSGVAQSLMNNWQVLNKAGFISTPAPSDVSKYIGWSYVKKATTSK